MITQRTGIRSQVIQGYNLTTNRQKREKNMKSITEDNLKIKIYGLELQLLVADKAMASYRELSRNQQEQIKDQQERIDMLLTRMNEIILLTQEAINSDC